MLMFYHEFLRDKQTFYLCSNKLVSKPEIHVQVYKNSYKKQ